MLRNKGGNKLLQVSNNVDWRKSIFNFHQYDLSKKPASLVAIGSVLQIHLLCSSGGIYVDVYVDIWLLCQS